GRPVRDCSSTSSPSTNAIARKPSYLGSNAQPSPSGRAGRDLASCGFSGGERGRAMVDDRNAACVLHGGCGAAAIAERIGGSTSEEEAAMGADAKGRRLDAA